MAENVKTVDQKVDELSAVVDRILKYVEDTPALKNVGYVSGTGGKSDSNLKSFADFLTAIARRDTTRLGSVYGSTKASDLTTATGEFGGYLVPSDYQASLLQVAFQSSPILRLVQRIRSARSPANGRCLTSLWRQQRASARRPSLRACLLRHGRRWKLHRNQPDLLRCSTGGSMASAATPRHRMN